MLLKVISGAQTGADQGGLEGAQAAGVPTGGWVPFRCRTEAGDRPDLITKYNLRELTTSSYHQRTRLNVEDGDGTLLFGDARSTGSAITLGHCTACSKPSMIVPRFVVSSGQLYPTVDDVINWIEDNDIEVLNVAGNRETKCPGIQAFVSEFVKTLCVKMILKGGVERERSQKG